MLPDEFLAPYAAHSAGGVGRRFDEAAHASRSQFQRDRDRIIHSSAFRGWNTRPRCSSTTKATCSAPG